jgi:hypothetical protein
MRSPSQITHIGYSVPDLSSAAGEWAARFGAGPFIGLPPASFEVIEHRGEPATFEHQAAFGQWGPIAVELQQIEAARPERMVAALAPAGGAINHVSYMVEDLAEERARLEQLGMVRLLDARSGPVELSLLEAPALGHVVELHQHSDFLVEFFAMVEQASRDWDGSDPIRDLPVD